MKQKLNKELDIPVVVQLRSIVKEYQLLVGQLKSEIDDLTYKNKILLDKGKDLEHKLIFCTEEERKEIKKEVKKEEMYQNIKKENAGLRKKNKALFKENKELMTKLYTVK